MFYKDAQLFVLFLSKLRFSLFLVSWSEMTRNTFSRNIMYFRLHKFWYISAEIIFIIWKRCVTVMVWQSFFLVSLKWKLCVLKVSRHHLVGNKIFKRFSHCINRHKSVDTFGFKVPKERAFSYYLIELSQNNTEFEMWATFWIPNDVRQTWNNKAIDVWLLAIQISNCLLVVSW